MLVVFDYFGVIAEDTFWDEAKRRAVMGGEAEEMRELLDEMNVGDISWREYCENVSVEIGVSAEDIDRRYQEHNVTPHVVDVLHAVKRAGHTVVLLSNASGEYLTLVMGRLGLDRLFDRIFVSSDMHLTKPDPRAYEYVLSEMQSEPGDAVMIDDNARNVDGAISVGMKGIIFESVPQCREQLHKLVVL